MHAFRDTSHRAFPRMHCLPRVVLAMADQHDPDTVGPSSPLFGFCSSDVVSAIPHGSKGVPPRASTTQHSTAQHGSSSDHVTDQQTVFGTFWGGSGGRSPPASLLPQWLVTLDTPRGYCRDFNTAVESGLVDGPQRCLDYFLSCALLFSFIAFTFGLLCSF